MPMQTPGGGSNQTLLELILSLKGLAQTVEFFHQDLSRKLDEESKARSREIDRLRDLITKTNQAINVLPITFSDRAEKIINKVGLDIGEKLRDVEDAITEVRRSLEGYSRTAERAISQNEMTEELENKLEQAAAHKTDEKADITGRIEVNEAGDVKVQINSKILKKLLYVLYVLAAGGGVYGLKEALTAIFSGGN